jgi:hypothetical protein
MHALSQGRWTVGGIALLAVLAACRAEKAGPGPVRPTPAPAPGFEAVVDSAKPSTPVLRDYVAKLQFDTSYEVGDEQRLAIGQYPNLHYGPLVAIQPEIGNHTLVEDDLHHGRIIARMVNYSDEPYPKLGLAPHSITYWWAQLGPDSTKNRSVMITTDSTGTIVDRPKPLALQYESYHEPVNRNRAVARWIWSDTDEQGWSACGTRCCKN